MLYLYVDARGDITEEDYSKMSSFPILLLAVWGYNFVIRMCPGMEFPACGSKLCPPHSF